MPRDLFAENNITITKGKPRDLLAGQSVPTQGKNLNVPGTPLEMLKQAIPEFQRATTGVGPLLGQANLLGRLTGIKQLQQTQYEEKTPGGQMGDTLGTILSTLVPTSIGAKAGLATKAIEDIRNIRPNQLEKAAETIINAEARAQSAASSSFGKAFEATVAAKPNEVIDITDALNTVRIERDFDPVINAVANAKGQLANVLKGSSGDVTAKEALDMANQLQQIAKRAGPSDARFVGLRSVIADIKASIAEKFPEYKAIAQKYKSDIKPLKVIRKKITGGSRGDPATLAADLESKMEKNWKGNSVVRQKLRQTLTKEEWKELERIRREQGATAFIRRLLRLE